MTASAHAARVVLDLRGLDWARGQRRTLSLDMGVGHAVVLVPDAVCVGARSDIGAGYVDVFGRDAGGVDLQHDVTRAPAAGAPGLTLDVQLGMGAFEVLHRPGDMPFDGHGGRDEQRWSAARAASRRVADRACAGEDRT